MDRITGWTGSSGPAELAQQPGRQEDDLLHELERASYGYSHQPEGEQEEPDKWIQYERQQRQRPAQDEQDAPQHKLNHDPTSRTVCHFVQCASPISSTESKGREGQEGPLP